MKLLHRHTVLILVQLLCLNALLSQTNDGPYTFINIENGATQRAITSIIQDNRGLIWMGTNGVGLFKYNGIDDLSYKPIANDTTTISSSLVYAIYMDTSERLWVGTEAGLNLYDRMLDQFKEIELVQGSNVNDRFPVRAIAENARGELFIGTQEQGLFKLNMETMECKMIALEEPLGPSDLVINSIIDYNESMMFVGTNHGLFTYRNGDEYLRSTDFGSLEGAQTVSEGIESLLKDKDGSLWIGTFSNGLFKIEIESNHFQKLQKYNFTEKRILSLIQGPDNNILCGTENDGLFVLDSESVVTNYRYDKSNPKSIRSNSIWSLFVDDQKRIWIGYYNKGVAVYDKFYDKFMDIESLPNVQNSLQSTSVTGMVQDDDGNLWIGIDGGGVDIYNPTDKKFIHLADADNGVIAGLGGLDVQTIFIDSKGNIWVGTWGSGIYYLAKNSDTFISYNTSNSWGGLTSNSIMGFSEDSKGTIWIATFFNGLHSYDPNNKKFTSHKKQLLNVALIGQSNIRKILVDSSDTIWLATTKGVFKVMGSADKGFTMISLNEKMFASLGTVINSTIILSLYQDEQRNIWIGTDGSGLCKYNPTNDSFVWYNESNGLAQRSVASIIEDDYGNIWLGGEAGLSKLDTEKDTFSDFTTNDGLLANDFNYNSVFKNKNGVLYFGSYEGINYFEPTKILLNQNEPSLYFSDFKLFNKSVSPGIKESPLEKVISETEHLTLNHKESVFTIEFAGINYTRSQNNQYAYYLEGLENSWNYVGNTRSATYTNLSPGEYNFKVKAANNDGLWNESPIVLGITVLPPWWGTKLAILTYFLLFLLTTFLIIKIINQRLKEKRFVKFERDKSQQEEILNEKKIQFFTNISHEFRTPLTLILNPVQDLIDNNNQYELNEEVRNKHGIILKSATRLMRLINELMDFRKLHLNKMSVNASKLDIFSFVEEVSGHFDEEAAEKNILFSIETDGTPIKIWGDPGMLEKAVFNILSNAFKATPEYGAITVGVFSCKNSVLLPLIDEKELVSAVEIVIEDTGMGIKKEEIDHIFERFYQSKDMNRQYFGGSGTGIGLEVVQSFINLHKGKIEVVSKEGEGTTFKIFLPLGKEHFQASELVLDDEPEVLQEDDLNVIAKDKNKTVESKIIESEIIPNGKKKTLLIVEDNMGLRNYLKDELKNEYVIIEAENGKKGLKLAKSGIPDIIITDVIMPEMDGFEFCANIKQDIKTSHMPVLMLTAKVMSDDRVKGIDSGADAYLNKPFEMKVLRSYLKRLITSRQLFLDSYFKDKNTLGLPEKTTSLDKSFITKVLNYINENIADVDLNVEHLAGDMFLSRSQLYRKIKAMSGMTANEFIRKIRLERAKQMIESGSESISEVGLK